jgi:hypothetical protein
MHDQPAHDRILLDALVAHLRGVEPTIRVGIMFGCPAAFVGRRMAFCAYGQGIGVKLPRAEAAKLISSGEATAFRPFGRPPMKEWIELRAEPGGVTRIAPVLALAVAYARELG